MAKGFRNGMERLGMHVLFEDREEAGKRLAKRLERFRKTDAVVLAIPRGGVPVAAAVAHRLQLDWDVIVARKLPVPSNPETGFGAVTADGSIVLNRPMISGLRLGKGQIEEIAEEVRAEVSRRTELYSQTRPRIDVSGRQVILLDDGLASGYTMLAAAKSIRSHAPARIVAAAPVASKSAANLISECVDECEFEIISSAMPFAVADFYVVWHDLKDEDILPMLESREQRAESRD